MKKDPNVPIIFSRQISNSAAFNKAELQMHPPESKRLAPLESGQLWKIEHGYVHIVELGTRLIQYKMLKEPGQSGAATRLIWLEALVNYLRHSDAELVNVL